MDLRLTHDFLAIPDRAVIHLPSNTAVLADVHLGVEAALRRAGTAMPDFATAPVVAAWRRVLARKPARIIVAGDLFHERAPDESTFAAAESLVAEARESGVRVTIVPGNHDPAASVLRDVLPAAEIASAVPLGEWTVVHGHEPFWPAGAPGVVAGHQHPAVILANRVESAKMICFATVIRKSDSPAMILLPAFSPAPLGSNLLSPRNWMLPGLPPDAALVRIAGLVRGRVLDFGPLSGLGLPVGG